MTSWLTFMDGSSGCSRFSRSAISWGDQNFSSHVVTVAHSVGSLNFLVLGRRACSLARAWDRQMR